MAELQRECSWDCPFILLNCVFLTFSLRCGSVERLWIMTSTCSSCRLTEPQSDSHWHSSTSTQANNCSKYITWKRQRSIIRLSCLVYSICEYCGKDLPWMFAPSTDEPHFTPAFTISFYCPAPSPLSFPQHIIALIYYSVTLAVILLTK